MKHTLESVARAYVEAQAERLRLDRIRRPTRAELTAYNRQLRKCQRLHKQLLTVGGAV